MRLKRFDEHLTTDLEVAENTVDRLGGTPARAFDRMIIAVEDLGRVRARCGAL
jgi:hypothetical protein